MSEEKPFGAIIRGVISKKEMPPPGTFCGRQLVEKGPLDEEESSLLEEGDADRFRFFFFFFSAFCFSFLAAGKKKEGWEGEKTERESKINANVQKDEFDQI